MTRALLLLIASVLLFGQRTNPRLVHKVDPVYSDAAREAKVSGTVLLDLTVDSEGLPTNVRVVRSLGYGLDETAVDALRQWRFQPATEDGTAVPVACTVEISFRLTTSPAPQPRTAPVSAPRDRVGNWPAV